jgi:hypothetical protein
MITIGIEQLVTPSTKSLISGFDRGLTHADMHGVKEPLDVILITVPTSHGDEVRERITNALNDDESIWVEPPGGETDSVKDVRP